MSLGAAIALVVIVAGAGGPAHAAEPALPRARVAGALDAVFRHPFAFCHDPTYPIGADERGWCSLLASGPGDGRCPELARACGRGAAGAPPLSRARDGASGPSAFEGLASTAAWVVGGLSLLLLAAWVVRAIVSWRRLASSFGVGGEDTAADAGGKQRSSSTKPAGVARSIAETDVAHLLARAQAAAAAGNFDGAIADAYAALLRRLEAEGVVRVEAHRTNGDHVRDLGGRFPSLRPRMQTVVTSVEQARFGGAAPDEPAFRHVHEGVVALLGERLTAWLPLTLALTLTAAGLASCTLDRDQRQEAPSGRAAVVAFLRQCDFRVHERLAPLGRVAGEWKGVPHQLLILPEARVPDADWEALLAFAARGGTVFVAGTARDLPQLIGVAADRAGPGVSAPVTVFGGVIGRLAPFTAKLPPGPVVEIASASGAPDSHARHPDEKGHGDGDGDDDGDDEDREVEVGAVQPILMRGDRVYVLERSFGSGRVVVLADDRLFVNASLLVAENANLLVELLGEKTRQIELVDGLTGVVSPSPIASVERGRLAPALLQLGALALLFFVCRGAAFGRLADPQIIRRRAFAEHVVAVGLQYARARAARHALEVFAAYALERMRERLRLGGSRGLHRVAEAVAARGIRTMPDVLRLLVESRAAPLGAPPNAPSPEDLAHLRQLATLLAETGGSRERIGAG